MHGTKGLAVEGFINEMGEQSTRLVVPHVIRGL